MYILCRSFDDNFSCEYSHMNMNALKIYGKTDIFVVVAGNHRRPRLLLVNRAIDFVNSLRRDGIELLKNT